MHTSALSTAMYWDESHLWGILLLRALKAMQVPVTILTAEDITNGSLQQMNPDMLLVPGGWARLKSLALGDTGRKAVRAYVREGGQYLGFCGGAGLALASERGTPFLDLCAWTRKPARNRLPNFSGHLKCRVSGVNALQELPVWWPSQFEPAPASDLEILARYEGPGHDFWAADLEWSQVAPEETGRWEDLYGINLNPDLLRGEPCVVRGPYGRGSFTLSYAHLETPDSPDANRLLSTILGRTEPATVPIWNLSENLPLWEDRDLQALHWRLREVLRFGQNHFLLCWRHPWLLGWRRGVPGSAINFLLAMTWQARHTLPTSEATAYWQQHAPRILALCQEFCAGVRDYLLMERRILVTAPSSPESSASPQLQQRKVELFGKFPGYGGMYGDILRVLDEVVRLQETGQSR